MAFSSIKSSAEKSLRLRHEVLTGFCWQELAKFGKSFPASTPPPPPSCHLLGELDHNTWQVQYIQYIYIFIFFPHQWHSVFSENREGLFFSKKAFCVLYC